MKITEIRFQNLNSLTGTWCIDFTDSAYRETSLFAITGPTGAGKSTLLDAICLALYGRTPRLGKVTKSSNEIMSRHTGACFAEVTFETLKGSFRCHWSQHRSRKKANGDLQQPKHEIAEVSSGTILASRMLEVLLKVEEVSGMDFDRFTRSTLLAQGGFAAFLQAKTDERAPLLEQITGSKIYSQISIQVHEVYSLEKEKLLSLENDLNHFTILPKEQEDALISVLEKVRKTQKTLKTAISTLRLQELWLTNISSLRKEIANHSLQLTTLEKDYSQKKQSLKALPLALSAKALEPLYLEITRLKESKKSCQATIIAAEKKKESLIPALELLARTIKKQQSNLIQAEEKRTTGLELINSVKELDFSIESATETNNTLSEAILALEKEQTELTKEIATLSNNLQAIHNSTQRVDAFFNDRKNDEKLITAYLLIETKITKLLQLRSRELKESQQNKATDSEQVLQTESAEIKKDLNFLQSKLQLLIRIQSLEEERARLLADEPCPLCGSPSHPYQNKKLVEISDEERLPQLISIQEMLHKRAKEWKKHKKEQEELAQVLLIKTNNLEHARKRNALLTTKQKEQRETLYRQKKALQKLCVKRNNLFGKKNTSEQSAILEKQVKNARQALEKAQDRHRASEKELTSINSTLLALADEQKRQDLSIKDREQLFAAELQKSPFSSINAFLAAILPPAEIKSLQNSQDSFVKKQTELNGLLHDKNIKLRSEIEKQLTLEDIHTLQSRLTEQEQQLEKSRHIEVSTQEQLQQNKKNTQRYQHKVRAINDQRNIFGRWSRLHMLIGSADGKKFRNFAQGLTFEMMVVHANHHLARMNNRYILVRDTALPLELNVIDTYQAGEIRSTKNLSGGESFLISLALALGLARMASNKIRVDSLFLDEGFGSLDEEALESALDTLSGLQEENKLIGVISHVGALKERIPLQIEISCETGGRSVIKGPGISSE